MQLHAISTFSKLLVILWMYTTKTTLMAGAHIDCPRRMSVIANTLSIQILKGLLCTFIQSKQICKSAFSQASVRHRQAKPSRELNVMWKPEFSDIWGFYLFFQKFNHVCIKLETVKYKTQKKILFKFISKYVIKYVFFFDVIICAFIFLNPLF